LPTYYSPVRRYLGFPEGKPKPLDLHVLGTPPAFVLSQDQTLHKGSSISSRLLLAIVSKQSHFVDPASLVVQFSRSITVIF
jgi:hypothetical protein